MSGKVSLSTILNDPAIMFVDTYLSQFPNDSNENKLLTIFAYGSWKDYLAIESKLPANLKLSPTGNAAKKLRKLTLLSLFADKNQVSYKEMMKELAIENFVDVESLVIDLIATELLEAKIDEQKQIVTCNRAAARCVKNEKESITKVINQIGGIRSKISMALKEIPTA